MLGCQPDAAQMPLYKPKELQPVSKKTRLQAKVLQKIQECGTLKI
jgi:hypothetical protein